MSIEVEIKLKIRDKNRLIESLRDVGFQQGDLVSESDIYYTSRHHDFEKLDEALRIRSIQNLSTGEKSSVITFKGAKTDSCSMTRKELETEVGDPKIAREVLESIGFTPVPSVEKERQHFLYAKHHSLCGQGKKSGGLPGTGKDGGCGRRKSRSFARTGRSIAKIGLFDGRHHTNFLFEHVNEI